MIQTREEYEQAKAALAEERASLLAIRLEARIIDEFSTREVDWLLKGLRARLQVLGWDIERWEEDHEQGQQGGTSFEAPGRDLREDARV